MKRKEYTYKTLQTDGVGVSICFQKYGFKHRTRSSSEDPNELYIDELSDDLIERYKGRILIGNDPGKGSPAFMMNDQRQKLRYTTSQRRVESQRAHCDQLMDRLKRTTSGRGNSGTISQLEVALTTCDSKTTIYDEFKRYIQIHSLYSDQVSDFYQNLLFRKMKWRVSIDRRRSEDRFLNRIEETFGLREQILICTGNWSQQKQMRHLYPSMGIGMRKIIDRRFDQVLVDEFRTSKLCNRCHHELEKYRYEKDGREKQLYRVLVCPRCQSDNLTSHNVHFFNRDANACMNMLYLTLSS